MKLANTTGQGCAVHAKGAAGRLRGHRPQRQGGSSEGRARLPAAAPSRYGLSEDGRRIPREVVLEWLCHARAARLSSDPSGTVGSTASATVNPEQLNSHITLGAG